MSEIFQKFKPPKTKSNNTKSPHKKQDIKMSQKNQNKRKLLFFIILFCFCFEFIFYFCANCFDNYQAIHRVFDDFKKQEKTIKNTNIMIISTKPEKKRGKVYENVTSKFSGVIFDREGDTYYALTVCHGMNQYNQDCFRILTPSDSMTNTGYSRNGEYIGNDNYYKQFPKAKMEYNKPESDLSIISFHSDKNLKTVHLSDKDPEKKEKIMIVSNFGDKNFKRTYGYILSSKPEIFSIKNTAQSNNLVFKHNAFVAPGSSGGGAYNQKMELTGIDIGGRTDSFGHFINGSIIPASQVKQCILEWQTVKSGSIKENTVNSSKINEAVLEEEAEKTLRSYWTRGTFLIVYYVFLVILLYELYRNYKTNKYKK